MFTIHELELDHHEGLHPCCLHVEQAEGEEVEGSILLSQDSRSGGKFAYKWTLQSHLLMFKSQLQMVAMMMAFSVYFQQNYVVSVINCICESLNLKVIKKKTKPLSPQFLGCFNSV